MARRFWNAKRPEDVTEAQLGAMTKDQRNTWEVDRYAASHGVPRNNQRGDEDYEED